MKKIILILGLIFMSIFVLAQSKKSESMDNLRVDDVRAFKTNEIKFNSPLRLGDTLWFPDGTFQITSGGGGTSAQYWEYVPAVIDDWYLPSKDELQEVYDSLFIARGLGLYSGLIWSSTEYNADSVFALSFDSGTWSILSKTMDRAGVFPIRDFWSTSEIAIGDIGTGSGFVFYKQDLGGTFLYLEAWDRAFQGKSSPIQYDWTDAPNVYLFTTEFLLSGESNTQSIITQSGHTYSAASRCSEHIVTFGLDTNLIQPYLNKEVLMISAPVTISDLIVSNNIE